MEAIGKVCTGDEAGGKLARLLVEHGSPTLANLKVGSLFAVSEVNDEEVEHLNAMLGEKGLRVRILRGKRCLVYIYRPAELERVLSDGSVRTFLESCGYSEFTVEHAIAQLEFHMPPCGEFPHEIGIFLGYPLSDVLGFILNGGKNCLCCGYWKVYSDQCAARQSFARFKKCKEVYKRLFASGVSLTKLSVATRL